MTRSGPDDDTPIAGLQGNGEGTDDAASTGHDASGRRARIVETENGGWVHCKRPKLEWRSAATVGPSAELMELAADVSRLNLEQRKAVASILCARDYCLLQGMPGTGKTTVVSLAIRAAVAMGRRVLLAAFTHTAVDNAVLKTAPHLAKHGHTVARVGALRSVHQAVAALGVCPAQWALAGSIHAADHGEKVELQSSWDVVETGMKLASLVAVTCLGVKSPLCQAAVRDRRFDLCIIDEASQLVEPIALGPILMADAFCLVGDHQQLPPLIVSPVAKAGGMGTSLMRRLALTAASEMWDLESDWQTDHQPGVEMGPSQDQHGIWAVSGHIRTTCQTGDAATRAVITVPASGLDAELSREASSDALQPSGAPGIAIAIGNERSRSSIDVARIGQTTASKPGPTTAARASPTAAACLSLPEAATLCVLRRQYRMNADVMQLVNGLVYGVSHHLLSSQGADHSIGGVGGTRLCKPESERSRRDEPAGLEAGSSVVAARALHLERLAEVDEMLQGGPWQWAACLLRPRARVAMINTDGMAATETTMAVPGCQTAASSSFAAAAAKPTVTLLPLPVTATELEAGDGVCNPSEATVVAAVVAMILRAGAAPDEVCVVSPYRAQLEEIRQRLERVPETWCSVADASRVEVDTIDRFQGRDKDVVIVSLVRSNDQGSLGRLLSDLRRVNVMLTRAKRKLIFVGSCGTLEAAGVLHPLSCLPELVKRIGTVVCMP